MIHVRVRNMCGKLAFPLTWRYIYRDIGVVIQSIDICRSWHVSRRLTRLSLEPQGNGTNGGEGRHCFDILECLESYLHKRL